MTLQNIARGDSIECNYLQSVENAEEDWICAEGIVGNVDILIVILQIAIPCQRGGRRQEKGRIKEG